MNYRKHAYLILAHNELPLLEFLVSCLDYEENDIYIHIDRKASYDGTSIKTKKSKLIFLPERWDARWGDITLVQIQLELLELAFQKGIYVYYHFLSGVDLPLKSQKYIHSFCLENRGKEFIGFVNDRDIESEINRRMRYRHIFAKRFQNRNVFIRLLRKLFLEIQIIGGFIRNKQIHFRKGPQWCSITDDFAAYLLSCKPEIMRIFSHTYAPDEFFVQTICWNSRFRERIYNPDDEFEGCLRFINWKNGILQPFNDSDIDRMFKSDKWFARKFNSKDVDVLNDYKRYYEAYISRW